MTTGDTHRTTDADWSSVWAEAEGKRIGILFLVQNNSDHNTSDRLWPAKVVKLTHRTPNYLSSVIWEYFLANPNKLKYKQTF